VPYLQKSDPVAVYLDVLLSLNLLHPASKKSVQGDGSIEASRAMLEEARRMGVSDAEILEHFSGQRFLMNPIDYQKFLRKLGLGVPSKKSTA
jgi:hypothetical protein